MPFYYCGDYVGEDPEEVHFEMSDSDRRALIYDFIMERYTLDEIADELSVGDLDADRYDLTLRALEYIMETTENGSGPDFGGYTWSDEEPDEELDESDNRRPRSASRRAPTASRPKTTSRSVKSKAKPKAPAKKTPAKKKAPARKATSRRYRRCPTGCTKRARNTRVR